MLPGVPLSHDFERFRLTGGKLGRFGEEQIMKLKIALVLVAMSAAFSMPARADEAMEPPVPVRTVRPAYPESLRRDGITGIVTVSCTIDEKGNVVDPKVVKTTNDAFSHPAIEALSHWKFKPAKKGGNAVPIKVSFPIQFKMDED